MHRKGLLPGVIALALLAGCQVVSPTGGAGSFQLGALAGPTEPQPAVVAPQAKSAVPPAPRASVAPPVRSGGGSSRRSAAPASVPTGTLTVDLSGVAGLLQPAAQRRILATAADVARLVITLRMAGQPDQEQVVSAAELQAGKTSAVFTALPTGTCTLTIRAEDATGTAIGTSSRLAPIAQAEDTELDVRVLIQPDAGDYYSYSNSLIFGIDLQAAPVATEGSGPVSGTVVASFPIASFGGLYADNAGHLYVRHIMAGSPQNNWSGLNRHAVADGSLLESYTMSFAVGGSVLIIAPTGWAYDAVHGELVTNSRFNAEVVVKPGDTSLRFVNGSLGSMLAVDAAGDTYFIQEGLLKKDTRTETVATTIPAYSAFAIDSDGDLWVNGADTASGVTAIRPEVRQYRPDGTLIGTYALPLPAVRLVSDGEGGVWVGNVSNAWGKPADGQLAHVTADGTAGPALGVTASDFCLDGDRNLWVAGGPTLLKLAPDGSQLGAYPIEAARVTYGDGFVFAGTKGYTNTVLKIAP